VFESTTTLLTDDDEDVGVGTDFGTFDDVNGAGRWGDAGTVAGRRRGTGVDNLFGGPIQRPPERTEPPPPDLVGVVVGEGA
jgi:hypothetical protein